MASQREKYLAKIDKNKRQKIEKTLKMIFNGHLDSLDITQLSGFDNIFRCRAGEYRIIFQKRYGDIAIRQIRKRGDIYKHI